jgi:hypothetical protein
MDISPTHTLVARVPNPNPFVQMTGVKVVWMLKLIMRGKF